MARAMTPRLYYAPATCSLAAMIALEVAGVAYTPDLVDLATERAKLPEISPTGKVPALETSAGVLTETTAIIYWLHKTTPGANLLPEDTNDFALALAEMGWLSSTMHIVRRQFARPQAFVQEAALQEGLRRAAAFSYPRALERLDGRVRDGMFEQGRFGFGPAGYALLFLHWAVMDGMAVDIMPNLLALARGLISHEAVRRALAAHDSPLLRADFFE